MPPVFRDPWAEWLLQCDACDLPVFPEILPNDLLQLRMFGKGCVSKPIAITMAMAAHDLACRFCPATMLVQLL